MLIESLIRLGKPFVSGGLAPAMILDQVSDIREQNAKTFLSHVVIVEADPETKAVAVEWVRWVQVHIEREGKKTKEITYPDYEHARTAPFVVPAGGAPTNAQGRYGIPTYIFYEKHVDAFRKDSVEVENFLRNRLKRTKDGDFLVPLVDELSQRIHEFFKATEFPAKEKAIGLLVLAIMDGRGTYRYEPQGYAPRTGWEGILTPSFLDPNRVIVADLERTVDRFWESKIAEGEEKGRLSGDDAVCAFCGATGEVISAYSKAWNWFTTTWVGPLATELPQDRLVEGVALCPDCYKALTYGSRVFDRLTRPMPLSLAREIFAPASSPSGIKQQRMRNAADIPTVYGGVLPLPVLDEWLVDPDERKAFIQKMSKMMGQDQAVFESSRDLHLKTLTGLEMWLPDVDESQEYRLMILYYSGDPSRADIHLRAVIEDVIPSMAKSVNDLVREVYEESEPLRERLLGPDLVDRMKEFFLSLPGLLTKAYGPAHVWMTLASVLHGRPLSRRRFVELAAARLRELTSQYTQKLFDIRQEVLFDLVFSDFLQRYSAKLAAKGAEVPMRPWPEMLELLKGSVDHPPVWKDVEELGFASGYLLREFGKRYFLKANKDYLESRVITFGNQVTPEVILKYGLMNLRTHAARHHISVWDLEKLLGSLMAGFLEHKEGLRRDSDAFLAAFWAGYCLNRPDKKTAGDEDDEVSEEGKTAM
ncbi:TM1802 family CRISPR-associated protein [Kyrpidia spormannii]|nr:TM1802 family CRISPR-associated protein [Kyrpidia spormannii]